MNYFTALHKFGRGTATDRQVTALDRFLVTMGSEQFNRYRQQAGIAPNTPNRSLNGRQAWLLLNTIVTDLEAEQ